MSSRHRQLPYISLYSTKNVQQFFSLFSDDSTPQPSSLKNVMGSYVRRGSNFGETVSASVDNSSAEVDRQRSAGSAMNDNEVLDAYISKELKPNGPVQAVQRKWIIFRKEITYGPR